MKSSEKESLRLMLHEGEVSVEFTKVDGTKREMLCTLSSAKIPEGQLPTQEDTEKSARKTSDEALRVFDLQKNAWRSFRYDSINKINGEVYV